MELMTLVASLVFTLGLIAFGTLTYLWLADVRTSTCAPNITLGSMLVFATVWFAALLIGTGVKIFLPEWGRVASLVTWSVAFIWPPLIMQLVYEESRQKITGHRKWKAALWAIWPLALGAGSLPLLYLAGLPARPWLAVATMAFAGLFLIAAGFAILIGRRRGEKETPEQRTNRLWNGLLWGLVVIVMGSLLVGRPAALESLFSLIGPAFPLLFVFVNTYFLERLTFFDIFVKRGSFTLLALLLLAGWFKLTEFVWAAPTLGGGRIFIGALLFLPLALALPWLYEKLNSWLDRVWLGRRFSAQDAIKHFLGGLQSATSEPELVRRAESLLEEIVQAPVKVATHLNDSGASPAGEPAVEVPLRIEGRKAGRIRIGRRHNGMPLFSRDVALLVSLAEVLSYCLENIRLQGRKQDQEKRARELMIHASQSELKALRAQINPHFLFNALNAIASLIPRQPQQAEETVEQLAEVFRYTLKESDLEWTRLEDEIEFVRAYLNVEKARFGERLEAEIELAPDLASVRIPTMIVQTLVENAVTHGIMTSRTPGRIMVRALNKGDRVRIEVADSGPGFGRSLKPGEIPPSTKGSGFGLRSVQQRLSGYYESQAKLQLTRDERQELTVVAIEFPHPVVSFTRRTGTRQ